MVWEVLVLALRQPVLVQRPERSSTPVPLGPRGQPVLVPAAQEEPEPGVSRQEQQEPERLAALLVPTLPVPTPLALALPVPVPVMPLARSELPPGSSPTAPALGSATLAARRRDGW